MRRPITDEEIRLLWPAFEPSELHKRVSAIDVDEHGTVYVTPRGYLEEVHLTTRIAEKN